MKLAIYKEPSEHPDCYHYFLHPKQMESEMECQVYKDLGNYIVEVEDARGAELLFQAKAALNHSIQISILLDQAEKENK